jgi:hypothetical protein
VPTIIATFLARLATPRLFLVAAASLVFIALGRSGDATRDRAAGAPRA